MVSFEGIWVPLVTPLAQGEVDHPALHRLVAMLDEAEQDAVLATLLAAAVIASTSTSTSTSADTSASTVASAPLNRP